MFTSVFALQGKMLFFWGMHIRSTVPESDWSKDVHRFILKHFWCAIVSIETANTRNNGKVTFCFVFLSFFITRHLLKGYSHWFQEANIPSWWARLLLYVSVRKKSGVHAQPRLSKQGNKRKCSGPSHTTADFSQSATEGRIPATHRAGWGEVFVSLP